MKQNDKLIKETKDTLHSIIKFFELLLSDLNGKNPEKNTQAFWFTWMISRYIRDSLTTDIAKEMIKLREKHPNQTEKDIH